MIQRRFNVGVLEAISERKAWHALSSPREMVARPKMSQNEWKPTEIRASKVGNFSPFSCPGGEALGRERAELAAGLGEGAGADVEASVAGAAEVDEDEDAVVGLEVRRDDGGDLGRKRVRRWPTF